MIPRVAHFVFGLREQTEPFHFLHYVSIESCRRVLAPERIYFHHRHMPWGPWWERTRPHVTLVDVDLVPEVLDADYSEGHVPSDFRYAHHSDFIRLDALLAYGGVYADIDTVFLRPFPDELFESAFVIGREPPVRDVRSREVRPSLCNALLMSEPDGSFARAWRDGMASELDGTWSNHSGFLSESLSHTQPETVRVEPEVTFFPFPATEEGLAALLDHSEPVPPGTLSVHLWSHLWWDRRRRDFSSAHGGRCVPSFLRGAETTLADMVRPYLPESAGVRVDTAALAKPVEAWSYLSLDEESGYGVAAQRCMEALEESGVTVWWKPFVPGPGWRLGYQPAPGCDVGDEQQVVIAHVLPEYLPELRTRMPDAFLVAHTVWDTDRLPDHWIGCLEQADLIVVPSRFSADAIRTSTGPPVAIVPHVAPAIAAAATAGPWVEIPEDVTVFYTIAEWSERKAVFRTVEAYLRAFSGRDRVLLIVKTSHRDRRFREPVPQGWAARGTSAWSLAELLAAHEDPPEVRLVTRSLSDDAISALHRRGDCFVSLARAEGWGLGAFDAAAHGTPVVTTGFGGQLDYLADSPHLVRFELIAVDDPAGFPSYAPDQHWAEPDVDHAVTLLREIAADLAAAVADAAPRAAEILDRYGPPAVAATFRAAVAEQLWNALPVRGIQ